LCKPKKQGDHGEKFIREQARLKINRPRDWIWLIFNHRMSNSTIATRKRARMAIQRQDFPLRVVQNTH